ncbi:MAG: acyl-CoA synthetase (AMP-forming)/AMP-acid ligase II [Patiriisocius sp.]|jgi:long-chain acyl-CoA synthetase
MNLTQLIHRNVRQRPQQLAICYQDQSWCYEELGDRVARFAAALKKLGVGADDRVALMAMNSSRYLEVLFAVPWAGGVFNLVNIRWSVAEVAYSLQDSGARVLVVDDAFAPMVAELREAVPELETVIFAGEGECPDDLLCYEALLVDADPVADAYRSGDDLAGISYTGGTTGKPKGVMLSHTNLMTFALTGALMSGVPQQTRMLHCAPLFHIAGMGFLLMALLQGGTQVLVPGFNPTDVSLAVKSNRVTDLLLVPTMMQLLLDASGFDPGDFESVQTIIYGASPMPLGTVDKAAVCLPNVTLVQGYGMTECGVATMTPLDNHSPEARQSGRIRSAGLAGPVQEVGVVDEQGNKLPTGEVGEIVTRGPNVMLGYWGKPELTNKTIVNGWLHTGDGGYIDKQGMVYIVDRVKDMIISGGENIYSSEVETVITQYPGIAQCAVIGIPSNEWGESVHAVLVLSPGSEAAGKLTVAELRTFCKQHIAGYKCPASMEFLESLPISAAGKILKTELRKPYWENSERQVS